MAIINLVSTHPNLSMIIGKNPNTQLTTNTPWIKDIKENPKISSFAWFTSDDFQSFRIYTPKHKTSEGIFVKTNNIHLNNEFISHPYSYYLQITKFLNSCLKSQHQLDTSNVYSHKIILENILILKHYYFESFIKHINNLGYTIDYKLLANKTYHIEISTNKSLFDLLNLTCALLTMQFLEDKSFDIFKDKSNMNKYLKHFVLFKSPYYLVYLFLSRFAFNRNLFDCLQETLKEFPHKFYFGTTQQQRFDVIHNVFKSTYNKNSILHDIGCGELFFSSRLAKEYSHIYAWDIDPIIQERNAKYLLIKEFNNITLKNEFDTSIFNEESIFHNSDILISEMLEHLPFENAISILKCFAKTSFNKLLITLPNKNFNKNYLLDYEFRHDDHHWEPTAEESFKFIKEIFTDFNIQQIKAGDIVDNESVSTLYLIEHKNNN